MHVVLNQIRSVHQISLVPFHVSLAIALNLILFDFLLEARVKLVDVDSVFFFLSRVDSDIEGWIDGHVPSQPILIVQVVERDGGDRGVRVSLLVRCVRDQRRQVLLQLGQVRSNVPLSEVSVLVIGHRRCNTCLEPTILKVKC